MMIPMLYYPFFHSISLGGFLRFSVWLSDLKCDLSMLSIFSIYDAMIPCGTCWIWGGRDENGVTSHDQPMGGWMASGRNLWT